MSKQETREVEYFGHKIKIPVNHKYVAMDESGEIYSYMHKPELSIDDTTWLLNTSRESDYATNEGCKWKESLREYPSLKPSTTEPKSERAKQFAEWFDATFKEETPIQNIPFSPSSPIAVHNHIKRKLLVTNSEIRAAAIKHIDEYTVPQYGDYPHDNVEKWTKQYCIDMVAKYKAREGTSQRSEGNLDYWKMMHYSQLADCKPDDRAGDNMIAELLLAFKTVTSTMTPDGVLVINGLDAKGAWHGLEFDYRDWLLSGQTEMQAKLELANRIVQWVDEIKKED